MADEQRIPQRNRAGRPLIVLVTQAAFVLNAVIWIVLGVIFLRSVSDHISSGWIVGVLMFGNAAMLAGIGWGLGTKYSRWAYYLALPVLLLNIVLGVTDQVGLVDVLVLVLNAVMLVLLLIKRTWYSARR